jgi:hypothetical protein
MRIPNSTMPTWLWNGVCSSNGSTTLEITARCSDGSKKQQNPVSKQVFMRNIMTVSIFYLKLSIAIRNHIIHINLSLCRGLSPRLSLATPLTNGTARSPPAAFSMKTVVGSQYKNCLASSSKRKLARALASRPCSTRGNKLSTISHLRGWTLRAP